ncbi:MAG: hypothetical protein O3B20_07865 [Bacteroidetes bacterium]|nr:hypothetical protein [Bacteroidota bacterium]MDA1199974.1 hypothetical protein [Bacteroidota bacterium]
MPGFKPFTLRTFGVELNTCSTKKKLLLLFAFSATVAGYAQESTGSSLHASRYIFSPTAFSLPKDSMYLNWVGPMLDVQYAPTENITMGIGTPLFIALYVTGGYSIPVSEKVHARVGGLFGAPIYGAGSFALPFAVMTFGTPDQNATIGVGYSYTSLALSDDTGFDLSGVALNGGAYKDFGGRAGLLIEGWYLPQQRTALIMPAFRIYTKRDRRYWNFGFMAATFTYDAEVYPLLGYDTNFDGVVDTQVQPGGNPSYYREIYDYANPIYETFRDLFRLPIFSYAMYL